MKENLRENFAYSTLFTFALTFVLALVLSWIFNATAPQVKINQQKELAGATLRALGLEQTANPVEAFEKQFGKSPAAASRLEETTIDGKKVRVLQFSGMGLWDRIDGILAVNSDVSRIIGLSIVEQKETPGLGGRISEVEFQEQFRNEKIQDGIRMVASTGGAYSSDRDNGAFDAVSGATLTSTLFKVIVNDAIQELKN